MKDFILDFRFLRQCTKNIVLKVRFCYKDLSNRVMRGGMNQNGALFSYRAGRGFPKIVTEYGMWLARLCAAWEGKC